MRHRSGVPFVAEEHPDCPPHPGIPATMWMHEDFESYVDQAAFDVQWPIQTAWASTWSTRRNRRSADGEWSKTEHRRNYHDLVQHIQAAPGGEGRPR